MAPAATGFAAVHPQSDCACDVGSKVTTGFSAVYPQSDCAHVIGTSTCLSVIQDLLRCIRGVSARV